MSDSIIKLLKRHFKKDISESEIEYAKQLKRFGLQPSEIVTQIAELRQENESVESKNVDLGIPEIIESKNIDLGIPEIIKELSFESTNKGFPKFVSSSSNVRYYYQYDILEKLSQYDVPEKKDEEER